MNSIADPNLYLASNLMLILFVDDILIFSTDLVVLRDLKAKLTSKYTITDLGEVQ